MLEVNEFNKTLPMRLISPHLSTVSLPFQLCQIAHSHATNSPGSCAQEKSEENSSTSGEYLLPDMLHVLPLLATCYFSLLLIIACCCMLHAVPHSSIQFHAVLYHFFLIVAFYLLQTNSKTKVEEEPIHDFKMKRLCATCIVLDI